MKRSLNILLAVFAFQALLFGFLVYRDNFASEGNKKQEPLFAIDFDKTDKVSIEGDDKTSIEVVKKEGKWVIPKYFNFPVSGEKIEKVLKYLADTKRTWPLGNTKVAAKQFEVSEEKFERRLKYYAGDKVQATVYLGNSPSFRKVYIRANDEDKTYSVEFNTMDAPIVEKDWADQSYYKLDRAKVAEVKFQDIELKKDGTNFVVANLKGEETTNTTETDKFFNMIQNPIFEAVLAQGTYDVGDKYMEYKVVNEDKSERHFVYYKMKPEHADTKAQSKTEEKPVVDEFLALKVADIPYYFKVRKVQLEPLTKFNRMSFVKKKEANTPKGGDLSKDALQIQTPAGGPG